jgi:hypothetical protein
VLPHAAYTFFARFRFGFALVACAPGRGIVASGLTRAISEIASLVESGMRMLVAGFATIVDLGNLFRGSIQFNLTRLPIGKYRRNGLPENAMNPYFS